MLCYAQHTNFLSHCYLFFSVEIRIYVCLCVCYRETDDVDLNIQCETFEDTMAYDDAEMESVYGGIDMSSHQEVFTTLFTKVSTNKGYIYL